MSTGGPSPRLRVLGWASDPQERELVRKAAYSGVGFSLCLPYVDISLSNPFFLQFFF